MIEATAALHHDSQHSVVGSHTPVTLAVLAWTKPEVRMVTLFKRGFKGRSSRNSACVYAPAAHKTHPSVFASKYTDAVNNACMCCAPSKSDSVGHSTAAVMASHRLSPHRSLRRAP